MPYQTFQMCGHQFGFCLDTHKEERTFTIPGSKQNVTPIKTILQGINHLKEGRSGTYNSLIVAAEGTAILKCSLPTDRIKRHFGQDNEVEMRRV